MIPMSLATPATHKSRSDWFVPLYSSGSLHQCKLSSVYWEEIVIWARKKIGVPVIRINSVTEGKSFLRSTSHQVFVIGLFEEFEGKQLCCEIRLLPSHYFNMQQTISLEIINGNIKKKSDAHGLFKVDPTKVYRVYDMLVKKVVTPPERDLPNF